MTTTCERTERRLVAIDASRGVAMIFVCLAHFATGYYSSIGHPERQLVTDRIAMVASPAFMIISGMMLGMLSTRDADRFAVTRTVLVDRGLFLLVVAHAFILVAHLSLHAGRHAWARWGFITDAVGFCLIAGPWIVTRVRSTARLWLAGALYLASWAIVLGWSPHALAELYLKDTFAGPLIVSTRLYNFPFLPWLALYLAGTVLGERLARKRAAGLPASHDILRLGARVLALAVLAVVAIAQINLGALSLGADIFSAPSNLLSPFQKLPPGPMYFCLYGSLALLMVGALLLAEERGRAHRVLRTAAVAGRASLFVFVLQYFVNFSIVPLLHLPDSSWWPLFFAASLVLMYAAARVWDTHGLNRWITVGYPFARSSTDVPIAVSTT